MEISESEIREVFSDLFHKRTSDTSRHVTMYTGSGGFDVFNEAVEENAGFKRVYIGHKVSRIVKKLNFKIHHSLTKGYYKRVKIKSEIPQVFGVT